MKKLDIDREYCLLKINQDDIFSLLNLEKKLLTNHKKCINQNKYKKSICGKEKDKDKKILDEINKRLNKIESNINIIEESLYNELDKLKPIKEVNENITDDEEEKEEIIENEKKIARDKLQKESNIIPISFSDLSSSSCSSSSSISTNSEKLKTRKKIKNKSCGNLKKTRKIKHYKNVKKNIKKPQKYDINIISIWKYIAPKSKKIILELVKKIK